MAPIINELHNSLISIRILEAAVEILTLETPLTRELGRHIAEKSARLALAQPDAPEWTADAVSHPAPRQSWVADTFVHCIANELRLRGVQEKSVEAVIADLNALYQGLHRTSPSD